MLPVLKPQVSTLQEAPLLNPLLKTFRCAADCGSFSGAAGKLFLSATAVRKQVSQLEEYLGFSLFLRNKRGITLTEAGRSLYEDMDDLAKHAERVVRRAKAKNGTAAVFRLGTSILNPGAPFMELWQKAGARVAGSVRLVPYDDSREGILAEIEGLGEKYDFLVGACDSQAWLKRCNFFRLGEYRLCCAVPRGHRLHEKTLLSLSDLRGECVALGARGDSPSVDRARDALEGEGAITLEDASCFYDLETFNRCEYEGKILLTLECWKAVHPSFATIHVRWNCLVPYGLLYPLRPRPEITAFLHAIKRDAPSPRAL